MQKFFSFVPIAVARCSRLSQVTLGVFCLALVSGFGLSVGLAQDTATVSPPTNSSSPNPHPDSSGPEWKELFTADLSNAQSPKGIWTFDDQVLTASEDQVIWSDRDYEDFTVDLEFKTASGTNSGVIVYATDVDNWIPNSVEIQIADDYHQKWASSPKNWQCGAIFGHLAPSERKVKQPGEWNRLTVTCRGQKIRVALNGKVVSTMDMRLWESATVNPDGSEIPEWLNRPFNKLATRGRIGLQGKHGDAPIYFRNVRVLEH